MNYKISMNGHQIVEVVDHIPETINQIGVQKNINKSKPQNIW